MSISGLINVCGLYCIESIYIVAYKNSVSSCSESEILHLLCTVFPVVPLFYAIQSLEQLVSLLHCHTIKQSCRGETDRSCYMLWNCSHRANYLTGMGVQIIIARTKNAGISKIQVVE